MRQLQLRWILIAASVVGAASPGATAFAGTPDVPVSLGYPNAGRLFGGRRFRETAYMAIDEAHANSPVRWALPALISVLDRASRIVARKFPGSILEIGELSRRDGGPISSHLSHQNGRDADVSFYQTDLDGEPVRSARFVRFDGAGESHDDPTVRFDEKRNWAFVRAILEDPHYEVRQIFIFAPLRARLLAYAAKVKAPRDLRARAARAMMQPVNALPHDDHFHVRISCPADQVDLGCTDLPLWRSPGSPDEFSPDLLAEAPRPPAPEPVTVLSPYDWGRMSKLWSVERAMCRTAEMICTEVDEGLACEDMGDLGPPLADPARDEMGTPVPDGTPSSPSTVSIEDAAPADSVSTAREENLGASRPAQTAYAVSATETDPASGNATAASCTARSDEEPSPVVTGANLSYCALDDEPNACERPVTALASKPDSTSSASRSVVE